MGIVFVSLLAVGLVSTGEIEGLGDTTSFLLLCVFAVVNVAADPAPGNSRAARTRRPCTVVGGF
ncbi:MULTISPECIES: hypothetical protein [unclassified Streptomyces]|uniref:hypothetical protein n=1 Tax=unclassified Streptomyces TaxID=2593676 RepID=UPI00278C6B54|nr:MULTISPECIES: hypothetical protein [unclassified Streptomyces]